jgi:FkbM family methyltransferase
MRRRVASVDIKEPNIEKFGTYSPGFWTKLLIECSRRLSYSSYLKPISSLCRKLALIFFIKGPIDYDFLRAHVRFQPSGNLAEKRCLLKPVAFDLVEFDFIQSSLPVGGVFLDVGANVGLYSLAAAGVSGISGRILSFDPNPVVFERLFCNVSLNEGRDDMATIIPLQLAVTDRNDLFRFALPENNLGEGRIDETGSGYPGRVFEVEGVKLLDVLREHSVTKVNIMKMDIEGYEVNALRPFLAEAPASLHPDYIIIERGGKEHWDELFSLCQGAGYSEYRICHMNVILTKLVS